MIATALRQGYHRFEWIHQRKNGEQFPVEVSLTRIPYEGRESLFCIWRDISEQKAREEALQAAQSELERAFNDRNTAEKRLADIAAVSDDLFWEQDSEMRFQFLSHRKFREMSGENKTELLGSTLTEWLADRPGLRASADWDGLLAKMEDHKPFRDFVSGFYSEAHGEPRWLRFNGAAVFNADGELQGYRGVGSDVTQL